MKKGSQVFDFQTASLKTLSSQTPEGKHITAITYYTKVFSLNGEPQITVKFRKIMENFKKKRVAFLSFFPLLKYNI